MDILTHLLSGAVAGLVYNPGSKLHQSIAIPKDEGGIENLPSSYSQSLVDTAITRKAVRWALLIGSVLPDIDIVFLLGGWSLYRTYHRGPTHSILGILSLGLLLSWFLGKHYQGVSKKKLFFASLVGMGMHVGLDLLTSYRTFLLWPFSDLRFSTGILRFHDRTGWWVLGSSFLLGWITGKHGSFEKVGNLVKSPTLIGAMGLLVYAGYILMQAG
ncbi:MAG: metal-dependent hydrolase [Spirochaetes bacterium]|nr:metal-dependent hydrolase [Spirochaetota bacterium]